MFYTIASLIFVGLLWGGTNPLIKRGSTGIKKVTSKSPFKRFLLEIKYLFTNWEYVLPLALNQVGSILYYITLQYADLSLAIPVANSLTFVFTAISGWILGEKFPSKKTICGMGLIFLGASLCFLDKL